MGAKGERKMPPPANSVGTFSITCDDIPNILNATQCHANGITGEGIVVGIVDSGFYDHSFFDIKKKEFKTKYNRSGWNLPTMAYPPVFKPDGGYKMPDFEVDPSGHGTGMSANLLSVAPSAIVRVYPVQSFIESLETACQQCQIISLSKATNPSGHVGIINRYRTALANAKRNGKIVCHANGNSGSLPWPIENCPNEVIKVGGVYYKQNKTSEASNYAMAHGGNKLPDICGLCGPAPAGAYIWLPCDPETQGNNSPYPKGWTLASGTSSATPQIAGICALMLQARARNGMQALNHETAKSILKRTARRVNTGQSADNIAAGAWTLLADAGRAVQMAVQ